MSRIVTLGGVPLSEVIGDALVIGQQAPPASGRTNGFSTETFDVLAETQDKIRILNFVPSLNTGICDAQTRRFHSALAGEERVAVITVSADLPFMQRNWCGAAGLEEAMTVSDYFDMAIGRAYGTYLKDVRLNQRAVIVVDADDVVRYVEYCPEIGMHPDYDAALQVVQTLL